MAHSDAATASPFHEGERAVHRRLGVEAVESWARQVVRNFLPEQHRAFHTAQPFLVAAARDEEGRPWATVLAGEEGFVRSPDPRTLHIDARPVAGDALEGALRPGCDLGLLGIELHTRRRNRVNGRLVPRAEAVAGIDAIPDASAGAIAGADADMNVGALVFRVDQSFGNCPQHISPRRWSRIAERSSPRATRGSALTPEQTRWIAEADTFFSATGHRGAGDDPAFGMDASHRGGPRGFVQVPSAGRLVFPDYAGNDHFNTIGNLVVDSRIGLLFVDFETGSLLQLSGRARIHWDGPLVAGLPDARRAVEVEIEAVVEIREALGLRWTLDAEPARELEVFDKVRESRDVVSFHLRDASGAPLPAYQPGQHLPIELADDAGGDPIRRTYSLSAAPHPGHYRISVKREPLGRASRRLHDRTEIGDRLRAAEPAGDFVLPEDPEAPIALVSAGVGVTPLLAMLHALAERPAPGSAPVSVSAPTSASASASGSVSASASALISPPEARTAPLRPAPIWWRHGARDGSTHPFREEIRRLADLLPELDVRVRYSRPPPTDRPGIDYDRRGRLDLEDLAPTLADP
ncbi:MAG: FAD-binding oxidoreductase, partial [bacterium]